MYFNPTTHTYTRDGERYMSVSKYLERYKNSFDKKTVSFFVAKNSDKKQKDILIEWELNRDCSACYGDSIHKSVQLWIDHQKIPNQPHLQEVVNKFIELNLENLFSEVIVFSEKLKVAGTIDILQKTKGGWNIYDIKTTKDRHKHRGYFKEPFKDIKNSKENEHILQLSMYKKLAESRGKKIKDMYILYWDGVSFDKVKVNSFNI